MTDPRHPFVKGDGTKREYYWVTDVPCSTCNEYGEAEGRVMGVISDYDNTIVLECLHCGQEERVRSDAFKYDHKPPKDYVAKLASLLQPKK